MVESERQRSMEMRNKNLIIISLIFLFLAFGVIIEKDVIFQEGNPIIMMIAISKLHITGETITKISTEPRKYLIRNKDGFEPFIELKEKEGWRFVEQLGAGLVFEKEGISHIYIGRMFTRFYRVVKE